MLVSRSSIAQETGSVGIEGSVFVLSTQTIDRTGASTDCLLLSDPTLCERGVLIKESMCTVPASRVFRVLQLEREASGTLTDEQMRYLTT